MNQSELRHQFDVENEKAVLEVKRELNATRDLRDVFVRLVSWLAQHAEKQAYLLLLDPGITEKSLQAELELFRTALRPNVAGRLHLVVAKKGRIPDPPSDIPPADWTLLTQQIQEAKGTQSPLPRADMQSEVFKVVLLLWLNGVGPVTLDRLSRTVGCTYRTVRAAIDWLGPSVEGLEDRRVQLKYFPRDGWRRFLAMSHRSRNTIRYADRSGRPRSPEFLIRRLMKLGLPTVAVGGVMGAKHHYRDLDIVGTPRVDLSIHAPGRHADVRFMERLDPGLKLTDGHEEPASVVLHFLRRKESLFKRGEVGNLWADPVECLADMFEARLEHQAVEFQEFLLRKRERADERS